MVSTQQSRLLFMYLLAFGLLTVPVILILINLVPAEESSSANATVFEKKTIDVPAKQVTQIDNAPVTGSSHNKIINQTNHHTEIKSDRTNDAAMPRNFIAGNWVVVDCAQRVVLQCPHRLVSKGTSPRSAEPNERLQFYCRDISINLDSFCLL